MSGRVGKKQITLKNNKVREPYSLARACAGALLYLIVTELVYWSSLRMLEDVFPNWKVDGSMQLATHAMIVFTIVLHETGIRALPKGRCLARLVYVPIYGLAGYLAITVRLVRWDYVDEVYQKIYYRKVNAKFWPGTCRMAGEFMEKYNSQFSASYAVPGGSTGAIPKALEIWMFAIILMLLLLVLFTQLRLLLVLLPFGILLTELLIGFTPDWRGLALFFAACVLSGSGEPERYHMLRHTVPGQTGGAGKWRLRILPSLLAGALAGAIVFCSAGFFEPKTDKLIARAPEVIQFQKNAERQIEEGISSLLSLRTESVDNEKPEYTDKEVMQVTASVRPVSALYLKGFCGVDYAGGRWTLDKKAFARACRAAGEPQDETAAQIFQLPYELFGQEQRTKCTVTYTEGRKRSVYLPYFADYAGCGETFDYIADSSLEKRPSVKSVTLDTWYGSNYQNELYELYARGGLHTDLLPQWYDAFVRETSLNGCAQVPAVEACVNELLEMWQVDVGVDASTSGSVRSEGLIYDSAAMRMSKVRGLQMYLNNELAQPYGFSLMEESDPVSISTISDQETGVFPFTYSLDLEPAPAGMDAVQYFLSESRMGYCKHFATAGVLMLRRMGVPARYVSGYMIRPDQFEQYGDSYVASVKDRNAHAWVEVYLDGIGWVPCEMSPASNLAASQNQTSDNAGDADSMSQGNSDTAGSAGEDISEEDTSDTSGDESAGDDTAAEDTSGDDVAEGDTAGDGASGAGTADAGDGGSNASGANGLGYYSNLGRLALRVFGCIVILFLCIAALCILVILLMRRYRGVLTAELDGGEYRRAVQRMNRRIFRRLWLRGRLFKPGITDAEYEHIVRGAFGQVSPDAWGRYMDILRAAAFSGQELGEEDARFCYRVYEMCRREGGIPH